MIEVGAVKAIVHWEIAVGEPEAEVRWGWLARKTSKVRCVRHLNATGKLGARGGGHVDAVDVPVPNVCGIFLRGFC